MQEVKYFSGSHTDELGRLYAKGNGSELFAKHVIGTDSNSLERYRETGTDGNQSKHIFDVVNEVVGE